MRLDSEEDKSYQDRRAAPQPRTVLMKGGNEGGRRRKSRKNLALSRLLLSCYGSVLSPPVRTLLAASPKEGRESAEPLDRVCCS